MSVNVTASSLDRNRYESRPHIELDPTPGHSQPRVHNARHTRRYTAQGPQAGPIQRILRAQYSTTTGSTNQQTERSDAEAHAYPRTDPRLVFYQGDETNGRHRDENAAEEADQERDDDDRRFAFNGDHAEHQNTGNEGAWRDKVERSRLIGEGVGGDTAEGRPSVEDGDDIEGHLAVGDMPFQGVVGEVEEDDAEAHKADKGGDCECDEGDIGEGRPVDDGPGLWQSNAHPHDGDWDEEGAEGYEGHDPDGPGEPDPVDKPVQDDGVDDASERGAR